MVIAVGASVVLGFSFYLNRRTKRLNSENNKQFVNELPPYRSLFEPTAEELRALKDEESLQIEAKREDESRQLLEEKAQTLNKFQKIWHDKPNKENAIELFRLAAESESAETFSQIADNVINIWRNDGLTVFTSKDLADLLESHLRILTQQERTSGKLFWLKQEILSLRTKSEG